jgi:tetratricopeptide (TPR) repeat protein
VVAIVGEPGVGKSRLVWEVTHSHRVQGWLVLQAGSVSYGKATSYLPVVDLLKTYFAIEDGDSSRSIREKVTGKLLTLDRAQEASLPALHSLLDLPTEDPSWEKLDPPQRRRYTQDAIKRLLLRETQAQPLLLVFEDLHWIDSETQALLDGIVESLPAARLLLVVNYRPEYGHHWGSKTYYTQLRLDPLSAETAQQLLDALLGPDPALEALKAALISRTEGNPFFLEESVRSLVETGALAGTRGAYRVSGPIQAAQMPATVQAVLAARIDRLSADDKRLLQSASVVGKDMAFAVLAAISEESEDRLRAQLAHLRAAEFIYETRLFPDQEYTFKHALTHETAYASVLTHRRRELHARIVGAIESLYPERRAEQVETLAHHSLRGDLWEKAAVYFRQAGVKAARRSAYQEAVASFEQALAALGRLPRNNATLQDGVDIRFELRNALWPLSQHVRGLHYMQEAQPLAEQLGDRRRLARIWAQTCSSHYLIGDYHDALEPGSRAVDLADELNSPRIKIDARHFLGVAYLSLGQFARSRELLTANMTDLTVERQPGRFGIFYAVYARTFLTWGLALRGRFEDARILVEEALRIAETDRYPAALTAASWALGYAKLQRGELAPAVSILEQCDTIARDASVPVWSGPITGALGYGCVLSGALDRGIGLLESVVDPSATENRPGISEWQGYLADAYLRKGEMQKALEVAEQALAMARERGERGSEALALRVRAGIEATRDPNSGRAVDLYQQGLTVAAELDMRPALAHCHFGCGILHKRCSEMTTAAEFFITAAGMYRDMGMGHWLNLAETELRSIG